MNIDGVNTGVVLDHIKAGKSMQIYELLGLEKLDCCVAMIMNAKSQKYGLKDIIKIDGDIDVNLDVLGYIDDNVTVNIVKNGNLIKKVHLDLPETLTDVIKCSNPRCISSTEQGFVHKFYLADREHKTYRCCYCDSEYKRR